MQLAIVAFVLLIAGGKIVVEAEYWEDIPSDYTETGQEFYPSSSQNNYNTDNEGYLPSPSYDDLPYPNHKPSSSSNNKKNFKLEYDGRIIEFPSGRKPKETSTKDNNQYPIVKLGKRFGGNIENDEEFVSRPTSGVYKKPSEKYWKSSQSFKRTKYKKYSTESDQKPSPEYDEIPYDNGRFKSRKRNRKYKNSEDTGSFIKRENQFDSNHHNYIGDTDETAFEVRNRFDFDSSRDEFQESSTIPRRKFKTHRFKNDRDSFSSSNDNFNNRKLEEEEHDNYEDSRDIVRNKFKSLHNDEEGSYVKRNKYNYKPKHSTLKRIE